MDNGQLHMPAVPEMQRLPRRPGIACFWVRRPGINPKLGREVTREEALQHLSRCREAALYQLVGRNKLDSAWAGSKAGQQAAYHLQLLHPVAACGVSCPW